MNTPDFSDLRSALKFLRGFGEIAKHVDDDISPDLGIANHYAQSAGVPGSRATRDEDMHLYTATRPPVLMGLFGARARNNLLLSGSESLDKRALANRIVSPIAPVLVENGRHNRVAWHRPRLSDLPILRYTAMDAGPYVTSGIVYARSPGGDTFNSSIHRLCVLDDERCTIWMVPGRHLECLYIRALSRGDALPISVNIGGDPLLYLTSAFSPPTTALGSNELGIAGAIRGRPVEVSRCATVDALYFASADIVLEGEILPERADEGNTDYSMPEFLGYMGESKKQLPILRVKRITTMENPIYQTVLGPGREQSEILAIPHEISIIQHIGHIPGIQVMDVHCPT
jgi:4-hydroxy-3-polyprenylbenzoate decarboxylase